MDLEIRQDCLGIDWQEVADILRQVGMAHHHPELHRKAFKASFCTVFIYDKEHLVGFGRAISDGAYQAAIYDCAVLPTYQGQGIGKTIVSTIMDKLSHCNIILYAAPGKEGFYQSLGFRRMKTAMARFTKPEVMHDLGFTE